MWLLLDSNRLINMNRVSTLSWDEETYTMAVEFKSGETFKVTLVSSKWKSILNAISRSAVGILDLR